MTIMDQFVLRRDGLVPKGVAATCSGDRCGGTAAVWKVKLEGRPDLTVHDTRWENGERDLVLYQPAVVPEMPAPLANLHNRRRAGVQETDAGSGELRVMGWVAVPGDRPTVKKTFTTAGFAEVCGLDALRELTSRPGVELDTAFVLADPVRVDLDEPQDTVAVQHALFFPEEDERSPVVFFLLSRVVPTLRHIGWLPKPVLRMPVRL
ncbi:hypothetical protein ABZ488_01660 [Streptomyces griseus]|uniref:hypothetical protein n=1 Tax=Streptomyces TaxID=1883 RepID=UPI001361EC75|nr:hypothetical protein [Streptomyces sp. SID724]